MPELLHIGVNTLFLIPGEVGGTEVYLRGVLPHLQADPTLRVTLFTNDENHDSFAAYERVRVPVRARKRLRRLLAEQVALPRLARASGCSVVFNPGYTAPYFPPCPQVTMLYDCQWRAFPADFGPLARLAHEMFVGRAAARATLVATASEFSRGEIARHLGIPESRIPVTSAGWDPRFAQPHASPFKAPYFLCIANTYPHKNTQRLVEAFAAVSERLPHALVLVGQPGRGEPTPHPRVVRRHRVTLAELVGALQQADALIHPSLYEGFGLPVLEGMAAGVPVFASEAGSIPEIGGEAIRYFDGTRVDSIAEALCTAASDGEDTRAHFVAAGQARAAVFSWEATARRLAAIFHEAAWPS